MLCEAHAQQFKFYGFVRNDFYYNSRQNVEALDGIFHIFPKPVSLNADNIDSNDQSYAEMISIATRLGVDIKGNDILNAKTTAKIESDFAGFSTNYYVIRIRQAYIQLNWDKTQLLVGQTWHPMFGSVMPNNVSFNGGSPFQPFNRSPQVRVKQQINEQLSFAGAAIYQMQFMSQGPLGSSASYLKNAKIPNVYAGLENKSKEWISGLGVDLKTIQPQHNTITSVSGVAYAQFTKKKFQASAKAVYGQNLSDHLMLGGYGVSNSSDYKYEYTNFNTASSWINAVYGKKWQVGFFAGYSKNLGTNKPLFETTAGSYTAYGFNTFYSSTQQLLDQAVRFAPALSYNLPNFKLGLEYDYTTAKYGKLKNNGLVENPYSVANHRVQAAICYFF